MLKKVLATVLCLVGPSAPPYLLLFLVYVIHILPNFLPLAFLMLLFSICGVYLFFKIEPCNIWLLPAGFLLSVLPAFILDVIYDYIYRHGQYGTTFLIAILYTAPFTIITSIIALVIWAHREAPGQ